MHLKNQRMRYAFDHQLVDKALILAAFEKTTKGVYFLLLCNYGSSNARISS